MAGRITVLPDERLAALRPLLDARVREAAELVSDEGFGEIFDNAMREVLTEALARAGAHEGSVWLLNEARRCLIPRFNNGPNAKNFIGNFEQPLDAGMISAVFATCQPLCENSVRRDPRQDKRLDTQLGVQTLAMIAVPLHFAGELRGVISAVQLSPATPDAPEPPGFSLEDLNEIRSATLILSRLLEYRLLTLVLGWEGAA